MHLLHPKTLENPSLTTLSLIVMEDCQQQTHKNQKELLKKRILLRALVKEH